MIRQEIIAEAIDAFLALTEDEQVVFVHSMIMDPDADLLLRIDRLIKCGCPECTV